MYSYICGMFALRGLLVFVTFILLSGGAFASKTTKGLEELRAYNFSDAKKLFYKGLKRERVGCSYGLALLYGTNNNPFFNTDSAYLYIRMADSLHPALDERTKDKLDEEGVNDSSITALRNHISIAVFNDIRTKNNLELFMEYIKEHPYSPRMDSAIMIRNEIAFTLAMDTNTYAAYKYFMDTYPEADEVPLAQAKYDELFFLSMTSGATAEDFATFALEYPDSPYRKQADKQVYLLTVPEVTEENLKRFVKSYPDNHLIGQAWKELYTLRIHRFTEPEISEFLLDYPAYPFREEVRADLERSRNTFYPVKFGELYGYVDTAGITVFEPCYEWAEPFKEGKALVFEDGRAGYLNKRGEYVSPCIYEDGYGFKEGVAVIEGEDGFGALDFLGRVILKAEHEDVGLVSCGMIYASKEDLYGYYNTLGELVLPFFYTTAFDFVNGIAKVKSGNLYGVIDKSGTFLVKPEFEKLFVSGDSVVVAKNDSGYGILRLPGDTLLPFGYEYVGLFNGNRALVVDNGKYGYVDSKGQWVIEATYEVDPATVNYADFKNGYAKYKSKGKFGLIDTLGNRVFPAIFQDIGKFSSTLTAVKKRDAWGYADADMNLRIPYAFNYAESFVDSVAKAEKKGLFGLIDVAGNEVLSFQFTKLELTQDGACFIAQSDSGAGLFTMRGDTLLAPRYDRVEHLNEAIFTVEKNGATGLFDALKNRFFYWERDFETSKKPNP